MPPFGNFVDLSRLQADGGLRVGGGLTVDRSGTVVPDFDGPLFVNARDKIDIRVGDGVEVAAGSPKRLVAKPDTAKLREVERQVVAQGLAATSLSATVATHAASLATLSPLPAPGAAVAALAEPTPTDLPSALLAIEELQAVVAEMRLRLQTFGVIEP
jgi:hypothetical protein